MNGKEIKDVITEYLKRPQADYAIMIEGAWGSGKTYFLTHTLPKIMEDNVVSQERKHYAYVSLYGIKSVEEISKEIAVQFFGNENKAKVETAGSIMETAANILTASLSVFNIDLSKVSEKLPSINIKNWVICVDDLERCCLPINEVLGFINNLVEHNNCGVIILANENEIGKISLNDNLELKYGVVLSGKSIKFSQDEEKNNTNKEYIDVEELKAHTKNLFNEDILYKTIREKVIGLTIKYEPDMGEVYDSIANEWKFEKNFLEYLQNNKSNILQWFDDENCYNLRTLKISIEIIHKIYNEMNFTEENSHKKIMGEFLKYIVQFMIYYRNGEDIKKVELNTDVGYVPLGHNIFHNTRGFKVIEQYCTTLNFSKAAFIRTISLLTDEYKSQEIYDKNNSGRALAELSYWWTLEDNEVVDLIKLLKREIKDNKYSPYNYPSIIGRLINIKDFGFDVGNIDDIITDMIANIENSSGEYEIDKDSYMFRDDKKLQQQYEIYIDKLTEKLNIKQQSNYIGTINDLFNLSDWADKLLDFCEEHSNDFYIRCGFIDIIDINKFVENLKEASASEIYTVRRLIRKIYSGGIELCFANDKDKLAELKSLIDIIQFDGINKPKAIEFLKQDIQKVIDKLSR